MQSRVARILIAAVIVVASSGLSILLTLGPRKAEFRTFNIVARQYAYDPPVLNVHRGDTIRIQLSSLDVVHGFYLEGHDIDAEIHPLKPVFRLRDPAEKSGFRDAKEIVFIADHVGKFRYRCSHTCGYLHPFMQGEFVVGPNSPYHGAVGAAVGIFLAGCFLFFRKDSRPRECMSERGALESSQARSQNSEEQQVRAENDGTG